MQVLFVLHKKSEVLGLIGVDPTCTRRELLEKLHTRMQECSHEFLTVVADLQKLEEAVACGLVYGHHQLLSHGERSGARAADQRAPRDARAGRTAPHLRPPPSLASAAMRPIGGTTQSTTDTLYRTHVSLATARGSTCVNTLDLTDSSAVGGGSAMGPSAMGASAMGPSVMAHSPAAAGPEAPHGDAQRGDRHASPLQHTRINSFVGRSRSGGAECLEEGAVRRWKGSFRQEDEAVMCLPPEEGAAARGRGAGELQEGGLDESGGANSAHRSAKGMPGSGAAPAVVSAVVHAVVRRAGHLCCGDW